MRHGLSKHPLYYIWLQMKYRCGNKNHPEYKRYGARGISVCDEWGQEDPAPFISWAESNGWSKGCGLSLDRADNDKGYCPENCRFITKSEQNRNMRSNVVVEVGGVPMIAKDAVEKLGAVSYSTVTSRLRAGWNPIYAVSTPVLANKGRVRGKRKDRPHLMEFCEKASRPDPSKV